MLANDLRKGDVVVLKDRFTATIMDNAKGNIRAALVNGGSGSIYVKDIAVCVERQGVAYNERVELSPRQAKAAATIRAAGF